MMVQKGGQVTKPIIVVKMPCKLLYGIQVKGFLIKCSTSWPYLISEFLVTYRIAGKFDGDFNLMVCVLRANRQINIRQC